MDVNINNLEPGMVLAETIYIANYKIPLICTGEVLTENIIEKLKKINSLKSVRVLNKEFADKIFKNTVDSDIRDMAVSALRSRDIDLAIKSASIISSKVLSSNEYSYNILKYLLNATSKDDATINIVEFSCAFAKIYNEYNDDRKFDIDVNDIAMSAILHNAGSYFRESIGEIKKLPVVNLSPEKFPKYSAKAFQVDSDEDYSYSYEPLYAYSLIKDNYNLSNNSKVTVLIQCETEKGNGHLGYDLSKVDNKSKVMAQIIQLAVLYERLLETVIKDENKKPGDVITGIRNAAATGIINKELTELIIKHMPFYSKGVKVMLSNASIGEVVDYTDDPDRPIIRINSDIEILDSDTNSFDVDLSKNKNLEIVKIYDYGLKKENETEKRL